MFRHGFVNSGRLRRSVRRPHTGFTLVEIMVIMTIIGLLAASFSAAVSVYQPTATADQLRALGRRIDDEDCTTGLVTGTAGTVGKAT